MRRALRLLVAILVILLFGIVGVVLFRVAARVAADEKPHSVLLKWNPPAPKPGVTVTRYNIYRTRPDGTFGPLVSVVDPTYVDTHVSSRTIYRYYVRAVAADGEGPPSNPASAEIP